MKLKFRNFFLSVKKAMLIQALIMSEIIISALKTHTHTQSEILWLAHRKKKR